MVYCLLCCVHCILCTLSYGTDLRMECSILILYYTVVYLVYLPLLNTTAVVCLGIRLWPVCLLRYFVFSASLECFFISTIFLPYLSVTVHFSSHRTLLTLPFSLYSSHYTLLTTPFSLYSSHCTFLTVPYSLYPYHCTFLTVLFSLYSSHCTLLALPFSLFLSHCTLLTVPFSLYYSLCTPSALNASPEGRLRSPGLFESLKMR